MATGLRYVEHGTAHKFVSNQGYRRGSNAANSEKPANMPAIRSILGTKTTMRNAEYCTADKETLRLYRFPALHFNSCSKNGACEDAQLK